MPCRLREFSGMDETDLGSRAVFSCSWRGHLRRRLASSERNVEGGRFSVAGFFLLFWLLLGTLHGLFGLTGWACPSGYCRDAGECHPCRILGFTDRFP